MLIPVYNCGRDILLDNYTKNKLYNKILYIKSLYNKNIYNKYYIKNNYILNKYEENSTEIHFINIRLNNGSWITPRNKMHVSRVIHGKTGYFSMPDSDWDFHMLRHTHASELIADLNSIQILCP